MLATGLGVLAVTVASSPARAGVIYTDLGPGGTYQAGVVYQISGANVFLSAWGASFTPSATAKLTDASCWRLATTATALTCWLTSRLTVPVRLSPSVLRWCRTAPSRRAIQGSWSRLLAVLVLRLRRGRNTGSWSSQATRTLLGRGTFPAVRWARSLLTTRRTSPTLGGLSQFSQCDLHRLGRWHRSRAGFRAAGCHGLVGDCRDDRLAPHRSLTR